MTVIRAARFPDQLDTVRALFREYALSLGIDLSFQRFEAELATLPGSYAPPAGTVLLAWRGVEAVGGVAMRPLGDGICEMKRLYVRPAGRGQQLGRRLAQAIIGCAREAGHHTMRLDTLPDMHAAQQLYASLGFQPIPAYVFNPIEGTRFLELDLTTGPATSV